MAQRSLLSLFLSLALVSMGAGCTKSGSDDASDGGSKSDGGDLDGGPVDAGDGKCHSPNDCPASQYCDLTSGECIDAKPCTPNPGLGDPEGTGSCESQIDEENPDYCYGGSCYCDLNRNGGTCLPRVARCGTCETDTQCGTDPFYYRVPAKCVDFKPEGMSSSKVCLPAPSRNTPCPSGYLRGTGDLSDYCVPAGGYCGAPGACTADNQCDAESLNPVCQVSPGGYCIPACTFDWRTGDSTCPNGKVCHMDMRLTQPSTNPNFGAGKCDLPCDVEGGFECPDGTECVPDGLSGKKRCRPPEPSCIRDEDCDPDAATHTTGYCNKQTMKCELGCTKPSHCTTGYGCIDNQCVEKTCIEQGGANIACIRGQFCCGEAGGPDCPTGVSVGECYDALTPPWCGDCATDNAFMSKPDNVARPVDSFCAGSKQWHSCNMMGSLSQCPQGSRCSEMVSFCTSDSDCGPEGTCGDVQFQAPGGTVTISSKACLCNDASKDWKLMCPTSASSCATDMNGAPTICLSGWCDMRFCGFP